MALHCSELRINYISSEVKWCFPDRCISKLCFDPTQHLASCPLGCNLFMPDLFELTPYLLRVQWSFSIKVSSPGIFSNYFPTVELAKVALWPHQSFNKRSVEPVSYSRFFCSFISFRQDNLKWEIKKICFSDISKKEKTNKFLSKRH